MNTVDDLQSLKNQLERICHIAKWNPSTNQLLSIREDLRKTSNSRGRLTAGDVESIVVRRVPDAIFAILDGVDNSDLKSLLLIALQATASK